jgi:phage baseplate assembly protein W
MQLTSNLYSDIPFFLTKNSFTNDINVKKDLNCIKQSIKNIILTRFGEKPFDYRFGSLIYSLLFETIDNNDMRMTQYKVQMQSVINTYEPRVVVTDVNYSISTVDTNYLDIEIVYAVQNPRTVQTLVISVERTR